MAGKKKYMSDEVFEELEQAFEQAAEHAEGKRADLRTTHLKMPPPPPSMTSEEIVALRESMGCSQAMFAKALNVSKRTIQGWEQGWRSPSDASLRLLEVARRHPSVLFGRVVSQQEQTVSVDRGSRKKTARSRRAG